MENIDLYHNNDLDELDELEDDEDENPLNSFGETNYVDEDDDEIIEDIYEDMDDF